MGTRYRCMAEGPALGIVDLGDAGRRNVLAHPDDTIRTVAVAADAPVAITVKVSMLSEVAVWDLESCEALMRWWSESGHEGCAVSSDGTQLLLGSGFLAVEESPADLGAFEPWIVG
jgi:hypothetical protein